MNYRQTKAAVLRVLDLGPLWTEEIEARTGAPRLYVLIALWSLRRNGIVKAIEIKVGELDPVLLRDCPHPIFSSSIGSK
jgi:hypothetical protein